MSDFASALPTKRFFLEMLTRDISLEDAVLDLVDNCVDSLARTRELPLTEKLLDTKFADKAADKFKDQGLPTIEISLSADEFSIEDNCGGIDYESAKSEVFRFGRVVEQRKSRLSVYGIGLKRAIFKIGREILVESHTEANGFRVLIDADSWAKSDDWHFPLEDLPARRKGSTGGTSITVRRLNADVRRRIDDGQLGTRLHDFISSAYALLLDKFVIVRLNGARVKPKAIPIGGSSQVVPARDEFDIGDVHVTMIASLAERVNGKWELDRAGWYVFCNGRIVVFADKSDLTGWGVSAAQFVSKYRGFVGLVFFFSKDPEALPWTTTKRGLNRESHPYLLARNRMALVAKPVLTFLNNMYASGEPEEPTEREVASTVKATTLNAILSGGNQTFKVTLPPSGSRPAYVSIQYKAKKEQVDRIKKHIKKPSMSASSVGQYTFDYFLENECGK